MSHGAPWESRSMAKYNPLVFLQEVRQEVGKVTWPTWKEVWITTLMVLIMVTLASIFFLIADQILGWIVGRILELGG
jgi:preprotein translocase subunit SecE